MDYQVVNEIKNCFWSRDFKKACDTLEAHLNDVDFDDDDDVDKLIDMTVSALKEEGGIEFLEFIIGKGFDINFKLLKKECLVLKCAQSFISADILKKLEDLGADMYSESSDGDNILLRCVEKDEKLAVFIIENYDLSQLDHSNKYGLTPLMYAAMNNNADLTKALIDKGSDVNQASPGPVGNNSYWIKTGGLTPLALAFRSGNAAIAELLLAAGADEAAVDDEGYPALFSLVYYPFRFFDQHRFNDPIFNNKAAIIKTLKNLDVTDKRGYTVLMQSLCRVDFTDKRTDPYTNAPITQALIDSGANVNIAANDGTTALHLAVQATDDSMKALVKAGADLNAQDNKGDTPLILACKWGGEKRVRYLLRSGADFNIKNNAGESAADICAAKGYQDALEMMI